MNIVESLKWRYATKKFDSNKYLSDEKIEAVKQSFCLTPTSYGLEPVKMLIIRDKVLQQKLVKHSYNQEQIAQASDLIVFCAIKSIDEAYIIDYFNRVKEMRGTPDTILKPFRDFLISDFGNKTQDQIDNWAVNQVYIALGNLMTVCAAEEIDACPIEGFIPSEYDKILNLSEQGLKSVLVMPIGYRAKDDMFADLKKVRKPINDSVFKY